MKKQNIYMVQFRRKLEGKTDYKKRLRLLLSHRPRMVIRKSNSNITVQIVEYSKKGDKVIVSGHSGELKKFGWAIPTGNIPAAYLTGLLAGKKAKQRNIDEAVPDIGLERSTKGSRIYAALRGVADAGISIPFNKEILPGMDRIAGKHIAEYAKRLKAEKADEYNKRFALYIKHNIDPNSLENMFKGVKEKITTEEV